jgi:hypothetical protein
LIFANPAFLEAQKRGFYAGNIPQKIIGYQVERTVRRLLREGRLPAKTDEAGGVILTDLDYYQSLVG